MTFGLGVLRLAPDEFWRMTLREISAAAHRFATHRDDLTRTALTALIDRHPDIEGQHG